MFQKPRGTRDFLPDEMEARRAVEEIMRLAAGRWGYREVSTPTFEELELFTVRSGEGIIQEMYAFEDKGGRMMALRPEVTAPVIRMYINEARMLPKPLRWCYFADCFRYERPQKGRYRQFWQFGVELIGADTALADAEVIMCAHDILAATGVDFTLHVGHLSFMKQLLSHLEPMIQKRIMMYLDKKDFEGLSVFLEEENQPDLMDSLTMLVGCHDLDEIFDLTGEIAERRWIEETCAILDAGEVNYAVSPGIARGLDYYTGMVFEGFAANLGAENQILGGGAYRLASLFGGDDVPSCGFAIGFDRVMVSLGELSPVNEAVTAVVFTGEGRSRALEVAKRFRDEEIRTEIEIMGRSLGAQLSHAAKTARFAVIIGKRECESRRVILKDLNKGNQEDLSLEEAVQKVKASVTCR